MNKVQLCFQVGGGLGAPLPPPTVAATESLLTMLYAGPSPRRKNAVILEWVLWVSPEYKFCCGNCAMKQLFTPSSKNSRDLPSSFHRQSRREEKKEIDRKRTQLFTLSSMNSRDLLSSFQIYRRRKQIDRQKYIQRELNFSLPAARKAETLSFYYKGEKKGEETTSQSGILQLYGSNNQRRIQTLGDGRELMQRFFWRNKKCFPLPKLHIEISNNFFLFIPISNLFSLFLPFFPLIFVNVLVGGHLEKNTGGWQHPLCPPPPS